MPHKTIMYRRSVLCAQVWTEPLRIVAKRHGVPEALTEPHYPRTRRGLERAKGIESLAAACIRGYRPVADTRPSASIRSLCSMPLPLVTTTSLAPDGVA